MAKVSTNVTIDEVTKKEAQALLADFGMDLSTAVNVFLKQMVYEGSFPFTITREVPNEETKRAIENVRNGVGLSKGFHSVAELMEDLYADD
jgi:DNA-damage-inducible protein J